MRIRKIKSHHLNILYKPNVLGYIKRMLNFNFRRFKNKSLLLIGQLVEDKLVRINFEWGFEYMSPNPLGPFEGHEDWMPQEDDDMNGGPQNDSMIFNFVVMFESPRDRPLTTEEEALLIVDMKAHEEANPLNHSYQTWSNWDMGKMVPSIRNKKVMHYQYRGVEKREYLASERIRKNKELGLNANGTTICWANGNDWEADKYVYGWNTW